MIENQYLEVIAEMDDFQTISIGNVNANNVGISLFSSGLKTQYYSLYNARGQLCGKLYLKANVVEAGVNQYTEIRACGTESSTTCGYYYNASTTSYSLSNNNKTCTVKYSGVFMNDMKIALTAYQSYTVSYEVNGGNYMLLLGGINL